MANPKQQLTSILWLAQESDRRAHERPTSRVIRRDVPDVVTLDWLRRTIDEVSPAVVAARPGVIPSELWEAIAWWNRRRPTRFVLLRDRGHRGITFGVTHYLRPECLDRCLASIRLYYPDARIDTQDTGGNLSWGRNELLRRCRTPYFVLLEEDMEITADTDIDRLRRIVEHDDELAGCGGWLDEHGQRVAWQHDFDVFRGASSMQPSRQPARVTPAGDVYYPCHAIFNFGVFRTAALRECPWDEHLELAEHVEFFNRLRRRWRVAVSPDVTISHARERPSDEYRRQRDRVRDFASSALTKMGVRSQTISPILAARWQRPNVIVLGVGHSNTTITTRQIAALGWNLGDADEEYAESVSVRELCWRLCRDAGSVDLRELIDAIAGLPRPWVVKAPTFCSTLHRWMPAFADDQPVLVWIQKDLDRVEQSYVSRCESPATVEQKWEMCAEQFERWPWGKLVLCAEDIAAAVALFDCERSEGMPCATR